MEIKKIGRPRLKDTIFLECPNCHNNQIKSLEKNILTEYIKWNPIKKLKSKIIKSKSESEIKKEKKSLIINIMD